MMTEGEAISVGAKPRMFVEIIVDGETVIVTIWAFRKPPQSEGKPEYIPDSHWVPY